MQLLIPFHFGIIVMALIVIVVGAVISDPLLMLLGALMAAMAITGLGMALRMRRRQGGDPGPQPGRRG